MSVLNDVDVVRYCAVSCYKGFLIILNVLFNNNTKNSFQFNRPSEENWRKKLVQLQINENYKF